MNKKAIRTANIIDLFCNKVIKTSQLQLDVTHFYVGGRGTGGSEYEVLTEIEKGNTAVFPSGTNDPGAIEVYIFPRDTTDGYMGNILMDAGFEEDDVLEMLADREVDTEAFVSYFNNPNALFDNEIIKSKPEIDDPLHPRTMA